MSRTLPLTEELLAEVKRLAYDAASRRAPLAVLPILLLSLVEEVERLRREVRLQEDIADAMDRDRAALAASQPEGGPDAS